MNLTNKHNLPEIFVRAVSNDTYTPGKSDFTATGLQKPARAHVLEKRHAHEITEDALDRVWALSGRAKHYIFEQAAMTDPERFITEVRFYGEFDGATVGGQIDLYDKQTKTLYDWKEVKTFKTKDGIPDEWIKQANVNRLLMWKNGIEVEQMIYIALYKDWSELERLKDDSYPAHPVQQFDIPQWHKTMTEKYISGRIAEFRKAESELPLCTPEERWQTPDVWVAIKKGAERATKRFDSETDALFFARQKGLEVQHRPGQPRRCQKWCRVAPFCSQYMGNLEKF